MKKTEHTEKYEPTLSDVLEAVQTGFEKVEKRLSSHDEQFISIAERFVSIDGHFNRIEKRLDTHDKLLKSLHEGQENMKEQMQDTNRRLINTQNRVEDIADILEIDHEPRITRLERVRA